MNVPKKIIIFFIIFCIAVFFRFYHIASIPPSPSLDEVSIGYNAYAILHTGKDEYGNRFPVLLRAYDDWRPALYVYLVIPFIQIFGLTVTAVRFPSVLLSLITVVATYFLAKALCKGCLWKFQIGKCSLEMEEIAMLLLAVSPWHIYISRLGHEANAGSTFVVLGALFFFISLNHMKQAWMMVLSGLFFSLSFYTYQSEKGFTPFIIIVLTVFYWKKIMHRKKEALLAFLLAGIITLPIFFVSLSPEGLARVKGTSAFTNLDTTYMQSAKQVLIDRSQHNIVGEVLDNRRMIPIKIFLSQYVSHVNPFWLYGNSGTEDFKAPQSGLFYFFEFPLFILGLISLFKSNIEKNKKKFLISWILIAFIPPSITNQTPHAMRSYNLLPIPQLIEAIGVIGFFHFLQHKKSTVRMLYSLSYTAILIVFLLYGVISFSFHYFFLFPQEESKPFQYALTQAFQYLLIIRPTYSHIVISNTDNLYQSYMFYLFESTYDPKIYLQSGGTRSGGFAEMHSIANIKFRPIIWSKEKKERNTLYVGNPSDFPSNVHILFKSYYLDGKPGVEIVRI